MNAGSMCACWAASRQWHGRRCAEEKVACLARDPMTEVAIKFLPDSGLLAILDSLQQLETWGG